MLMAPHTKGVAVCLASDRHRDVEVLKGDVPLTVLSGY